MESLLSTPLPPAVPSPPGLQTLILTATTLSQLKPLHAHLLKSNLLSDLSSPFLSKLLSFPPPLSAYSAAALLHLPAPSAAVSNRALRALSRSSDNPLPALRFYARIRTHGVALGRFAFPPLLRAAARAGAAAVGREAHGVVVKLGFGSDPFVQTGLVGVYGAVGRIRDAREVFERMAYRDVVAWNVMMDGYCQAGCYAEALQLFDEMRSSAIAPDYVILATALSACSHTKNLAFGKSIHSYISDSNIPIDARLQTALINFYSNCGSMDIAQKLYDETSPENPIASTAMVSGYAKIGQLSVARDIFDRMATKDLVAWSAMISAYADSDWPTEALKLFNDMKLSGVHPDQITMLSVISACANLGALDQAKWVHIYVDKNGFGRKLSVSNALIDMYSKCGSLATARKIFNEMPKRNVITWTTMITGLAMHGEGMAAISLFDQMKAEGIKPNKVTFVSLLHACSHSGLVDQGRRLFESMAQDYGLEPEQEHYGCMVDVFGRAKLFNEAIEIIKSMAFQPNVIIWGSLLGACRVHGEVELGELAAKRLLELDPGHDGAHVLLSNIYAKANRWGDVGEVRRLMKDRGISKERGCSWIELDGKVHEFAMGDESHSKSIEIYEKLDEVVKELEVAGYDPNLASVLVDLEEEEKRGAILLHSEKLALSFGLISSANGACIRIAKNLRVCEDCHSFMKLASKVFEREIIVRDRTRFHHYRDGVCSCGDFW